MTVTAGAGPFLHSVPMANDDDPSGHADFPHLDHRGNARMVDVTGKATTERRAVARGELRMSPATLERLLAGDLPGGDVLAAARTAAILGAKRTADLLPLCHPLLLGDITVDFEPTRSAIAIAATVEALDRTGVEMEALTACAIAALTIYETCKSVDDDLVIDAIAVWHKAGGRTGTWERTEDGAVTNLPAPGPARS